MSESLVTGGTGFVGLCVVKLLVERGRHVNTTVRTLKNTTKWKLLRDRLFQYPGTLTPLESDLVKDASFGEAMDDCQVVHHIALPLLVPAQIKDRSKKCVKPALSAPGMF